MGLAGKATTPATRKPGGSQDTAATSLQAAEHAGYWGISFVGFSGARR